MWTSVGGQVGGGVVGGRPFRFFLPVGRGRGNSSMAKDQLSRAYSQALQKLMGKFQAMRSCYSVVM